MDPVKALFGVLLLVVSLLSLGLHAAPAAQRGPSLSEAGGALMQGLEQSGVLYHEALDELDRAAMECLTSSGDTSAPAGREGLARSIEEHQALVDEGARAMGNGTVAGAGVPAQLAEGQGGLTLLYPGVVRVYSEFDAMSREAHALLTEANEALAALARGGFTPLTGDERKYLKLSRRRYFDVPTAELRQSPRASANIRLVWELRDVYARISDFHEAWHRFNTALNAVFRRTRVLFSCPDPEEGDADGTTEASRFRYYDNQDAFCDAMRDLEGRTRAMSERFATLADSYGNTEGRGDTPHKAERDFARSLAGAHERLRDFHRGWQGLARAFHCSFGRLTDAIMEHAVWDGEADGDRVASAWRSATGALSSRFSDRYIVDTDMEGPCWVVPAAPRAPADYWLAAVPVLALAGLALLAVPFLLCLRSSYVGSYTLVSN